MQPSAGPPHPRYSPPLIAAPAKDPPMSIRLALCLLLLCASLPLVARDMPLLSAHDSGCTDDTATQDDDVAVRPARTEPVTHTVKPVKAQPGVRHGGANVGEIRQLRWHSFLPGMLRRDLGNDPCASAVAAPPHFRTPRTPTTR